MATPGPDRDLEAELAAERANTEHWRHVARQRSDAQAALERRLGVRAVLLLDRLTVPARRSGRQAWMRAAGLAHRTTRSAAALGGRGGRDDRLARLADELRHLPAPEVDLDVTVVVVGDDPPDAWSALERLGVTVERVETSPGESHAASVRRVLAAATTRHVCLVRATTTPLDDTWLVRLTAAIDQPGGEDRRVAATPVTVHPRRSTLHATEHDGLVRAAGLAISEARDRTLVVEAVDAGRAPDATAAPARVALASSACLVVERSAYVAAGGLPPRDDLDLAVIELCARLADQGGAIVAVPAAAVVDHRPVPSRHALHRPIDTAGPSWRTAIDHAGPALRRASLDARPDHVRIVLTVAAPSRKIAHRWGDWHVADGMARALSDLGLQVAVRTLDQVDEPATRTADLHVVVRGMRPVRRTPGQRHILWVISHPEGIDDAECDDADLVLVASERFAEHLRARTTTSVEVLLQATDHHRFRPLAPVAEHAHPVTVVAKTREVMRPIVADAITAGLRPAIYGGGWEGLVDPGLIVAEHVPNEELPAVYSSAGVVLNDHWATMRAWGFVSNRLFDVLACRTPVVSDQVEGLDAMFDGAVATYTTPEQLSALVSELLADPQGARARAERGRRAVLARHTFRHRADELVRLLEARCLWPRRPSSPRPAR